MKNQRQAVWYVSPHERLASLRAVTFLQGLPTDELLALAEHTREVHHRRGAILVERGSPVHAFRILIDGEAMIRRNGQNIRRVEAGFPLGVLALLARDERDTEVVTVSPALTLEMDTTLFFALLEERFGIFHHVLRATARQLKHERSLRHGRAAPETKVTKKAITVGDDLDVVDRFLALRESVPFGGDDLFGLWHLARRASFVRFAAGDTLRTEGQPATRIIVLTEGATEYHHVGDAIGAIDALAEGVNHRTDTATEPSAGIVIEREEILDIFEDHFEMASSCLALMAGLVIDLIESRAAEADEIPSGFERLT